VDTEAFLFPKNWSNIEVYDRRATESDVLQCETEPEYNTILAW
jgi:hypothetical protein